MIKLHNADFWIALVCVAVIPLNANSQSNEVSKQSSSAIKISVNPFLSLERQLPKVEIVLGESEAQKREKAAVKSNVPTRDVIARSDAPAREDLSLDQLRGLYREAANKFGIDWKLIEAVHQVESGKSGSTSIRSSAGATGPMQFLPSTFRHYANEGNDITDLRSSVFAAANLLAQSGANTGDINSALLSYNHSMSYVNKVKGVMDSI
ncbi:MAG: lytic transglycosylase domain-containing protein [Candidatus Berkelbacteria bacterium]|nr:lytic transglycosylase domain-containing protein [Candidatus Berkelbacteria bacterium]